MQCQQCGKETTNPKFCSRSCVAIFTNKANPKRKKVYGKCVSCGNTINRRNKYCRDCRTNHRNTDDTTLEQMTARRNYQKFSQIRDMARQKYAKSDKPKKCMICGYDKTFHVCHIKPLRDFTPSATLGEVNHFDNLIALCPNHHWEFDNGILILP